MLTNKQMEIALFELSSALHKEALKPALEEPFIRDVEAKMNGRFSFYGSDFSSYGTHDVDLIYIRTGGTEGLFLKHLGHLFQKNTLHNEALSKPFRLLTSGESNSLAASMEILTFLQQHGAQGEILHGENILEDGELKLQSLPQDCAFGSPTRLGVIGAPSDWLIASSVDYEKAKKVFNAELVDIPLTELTTRVVELQEHENEIELRGFRGSELIYEALKTLISDYALNGLTLRCFDLLTSLHNTGCLALARLNAEGIPSSCEGDIPALLTMMYAKQVYGTPGFQCNLSRITQGENDELLFAHCTVPLNLCTSYKYNTHFESGIGTAIKGELPLCDVRIIKIAPDLEHYVSIEGRITANSAHPNLCRTQITISAKQAAAYFLRHPLANHHIVVPVSKKG